MNTADLDDIWADLDTETGDQIRWMRGDQDFVAEHFVTIFALPLRFGGMGCAARPANRFAARAASVQLATRTYVDAGHAAAELSAHGLPTQVFSDGLKAEAPFDDAPASMCTDDYSRINSPRV
jgi:hypothetical protein